MSGPPPGLWKPVNRLCWCPECQRDMTAHWCPVWEGVAPFCDECRHRVIYTPTGDGRLAKLVANSTGWTAREREG